MSGAQTRILIVGGRSNAARVLRDRLAAADGFVVTVLTRAPEAPRKAETVVVVADYFAPPAGILQSADVVVNFAGVVQGPPALLDEINVRGALQLAEAAKGAGARQFVQISSLSVYGHAEDIGPGVPEAPVNDYGRSKLAGDRALAGLADDRFLVTSLRAPIFYSRATGGKLHQLARLMRRLGWFPAPHHPAPRSVLHLDNLAGAIETVIRQRLGGVRFAADPEPFRLDVLAEVLSRSGGAIRLLTLPGPVFSLIRALSPGTYASLYGKSLIAADACVPVGNARPLRSGLADLV